MDNWLLSFPSAFLSLLGFCQYFVVVGKMVSLASNTYAEVTEKNNL